jgi:hypothetical protein
MHETLNSYLSACLVMVDIRALIIPSNAPILSLQRSSLSKSETFIRLDGKPTYAHLMNRTCPKIKTEKLLWKIQKA